MSDIWANQGNDNDRKDHCIGLKELNRMQVSELTKLDVIIPKNVRLMPVGNICLMQVDAIVNSANEALTGGGGLDEIIHKMAGKRLLEECSGLPKNSQGVRCFTGCAAITGAYNIQNLRYIIHTVAPYLDVYDQPQPLLLAKCYQSCMEVAKWHSIGSIAFPSLGTGYYGYPIAQAAEIAVRTLVECANTMTGTMVYIVPYSKLDEAAYRRLFGLSDE